MTRLFVVIEGEIVITLNDRAINNLQVGGIFGEMALVDDGPRSASATAVTDCKLAPINHQDFLRFGARFTRNRHSGNVDHV